MAVFLAACLYLANGVAAAQTVAADPRPLAPITSAVTPVTPADAQADDPAALAPNLSIANSDAPASPIESTPSPTASGSLPVIAYVKHTKPVQLIDSTPGKAAFAMIGVVAMIAAGAEIVEKNAVEDPSEDMARKLTTAFAASKNAALAETPMLDDHKWTRGKASELAAQANGAIYIVDVEMPFMNLIYFPSDWIHFDLMFGSRVRIVDAKDGAVVGEARCLLNRKKSPESLTHSELLADNAAALKHLIATKSDECVAEMKTKLKL